MTEHEMLTEKEVLITLEQLNSADSWKPTIDKKLGVALCSTVIELMRLLQDEKTARKKDAELFIKAHRLKQTACGGKLMEQLLKTAKAIAKEGE